jgi:hypothetical protein
MKSSYIYEYHWPKTDKEFDLKTISGAMEVGQDLFLIGSFGGFGGSILFVHADLNKAKEHVDLMNKDPEAKHYYKIYRMQMNTVDL